MDAVENPFTCKVLTKAELDEVEAAMTGRPMDAVERVERRLEAFGPKYGPEHEVIVHLRDIRELVELARSNSWQDIETAPLDTLVLAWCPNHRLVLLERHSERATETWAVSPSGRMDCPEPTHWQHLPSPPNTGGG